MESDSSKLENYLENEDDFLNEIIESNREISSAISIEVSEDLFKEFTPEINFSPLRYSDNKESEFKEQKLPDNVNNILNDFNASLKSYNDDFQKDNDGNDNDRTLMPDIQYDQENTESSSNINRTVIIKSTVTFDSVEEYDYLYADLYTQTLEITVPNEVNENMNHSPIAETLKHQNHFEGCSPEFNFKNIGNVFTVTVSTEQNHSRAENNIYEPFKINNNVVPEELNNDIVEKTTKSFKIDNELVSDDNTARRNVVLKEGNITEPVKSAIDDKNILIDQIKLEQNDNVDKTSETSKINSEITSNNMNVTFRNFIQTEFSNETINTTEERSFLNNAETIDNCVHLQNNNDIKCSTLQTTENNVVVVTLNENNSVVPQTLKRPAEDIPTSENKAKKQKLNDIPATVTKEPIPGTSKTNNGPASSKTDEIIIIRADPTSSTADINFTQAIFVDHDETADNNDSKWLRLKDLETKADYIESHRTQWLSLPLPNPHKSNINRHVPENITNNEPYIATSSENERVTSCGEFLEKRIQNMSSEIIGLYAKMNRQPRIKDKKRRRINSAVKDLRQLQREVEKNIEDLKHINMFYYNDAQGWNANYLTQPELSTLEEQDQVLKFQKNFYN